MDTKAKKTRRSLDDRIAELKGKQERERLYMELRIEMEALEQHVRAGKREGSFAAAIKACGRCHEALNALDRAVTP